MADDERLQNLSRSLFLSAFAGGNRISPWQIERLAPTLDERVALPGTVLYREGETPEFVYFMERGEVELSRASVPPVIMEGKWLLGALESAIELPRARTATVLTNTRLVSAPAEVWRTLFEDDFSMARNAFLASSRGLLQLYARLTTEQLELNQRASEMQVPADGPLDLVERLLALSVPQLTHLAGMQALTRMAQEAEEVHLGDARKLLREGEGLRAHLLLSGVVTAARIGGTATVRVTPGHFLPLALVENVEAFELRSDGPIRTLAFEPELIVDEFEEHPDLLRSVLATQWREREWLFENLLVPDGKIVLR